MPEQDPLISEYSHLQKFPREKEALQSLKKIASLVKPLMRNRGWKVGTLAEFYPEQQNLLGLNVNKGHKICLRLRYPGDRNQFLPQEQVVDTMLHELSHNVFGPHNADFHALWDQLRKEYEGLLSKGYTGEGFLSDGHKLGGRRVPRDEARRIARAAAEKRQTLYAGSGQKLGGAPVRVGTDIRRVIVDAIERRNTVLKGCGSDNNTLNDKDVIDLANDATNNGFKTKAEEDKANDRAIAQALWELVQEDEKKKYGKEYISPSPTNPAGSGGAGSNSQQPIKTEASSSTQPTSQRQPPKHVSRLVSEGESKRPKTVPKRASEPLPNQSSSVYHPDPPAPTMPTGWTCPICTLHNRIDFLCCDACTVERPEEITRQVAAADRERKSTNKSSGKTSSHWTCRSCLTVMEDKWWTCAKCGLMKDSS